MLKLLLRACENNDLSLLDKLITSSNEDIINQYDDRGLNPLFVACIKGNVILTQTLIAKGAKVKALAGRNWTPLHEACRHQHGEIVQILIANSAEVNAEDIDGNTPLHASTECWPGKYTIISNLIDAGANVLVSGSTIFKQNDGDLKKNISLLRSS